MRKSLVVTGIGNTMVRAALTDRARSWPAKWRSTFEVSTSEFAAAELAEWLPERPVAWRLASVHRPSEREIRGWVTRNRAADEFTLLEHHQLPLRIAVPAPEKVGMDRLVTAVAANRLREQDRPAIIVDAGTAVTVDAIDRQGSFLGGAILPGLRIAARALADHTDLLPEVRCENVDESLPAIGTATEPAIRSGLFYGCVGAVRELVGRMSEELSGSTQVFVTGGDARSLTHLLDKHATFVSDLGLQGIVAAVEDEMNDS